MTEFKVLSNALLFNGHGGLEKSHVFVNKLLYMTHNSQCLSLKMIVKFEGLGELRKLKICQYVIR